ncbi:restriction endonuclease subunit S [Pelomonas sp. KK5]|uniref:restriction endonuclease subunit S n=1 Tax=Pelomonas sp. KK5 TaxID=1855730 RepID=UPI00097BC4F3|nr:restriction endonuclease subunit S [Pelomonas sp. KK5]
MTTPAYLPSGWIASSLQEISDSMGGSTPDTSDSKYWSDGTVPWVSPKDMKSFRLRSTIDRVTDSALARLSLVPESSVLVVVRSGILSRTLPVALNMTPVTLNQDMRAFVPRAGVSSEYLAWHLVASEREILQQCTKDGTTVASVEGGRLASHALAIAPTVEQSRIVDKIEELFTELDAGVAELQAAQKKLARYRQSLLKVAVEGTLTAQWREQHPAAETGHELLARILEERRARWEAKQLAKFSEQGKAPPKGWEDKYPSPCEPETDKLPVLPDGWAWASAEQLCDFITKGTTPPKDLPDSGHKTVPFLRVTNLTDSGSLDLSDKVFVSEQTHRGFLARSLVYPGDVLMNIVGPPLGQVSRVPATFPEWNINQAIAIFRPLGGFLPAFMSQVLLSSHAQQWLQSRAKTTAGQTNLTLELCRALPVPVPPISEQSAICELIESAIESCERIGETARHGLRQAAAQRQNILRAAFSGQLVPQDPADEPASALLARIRAERAGRAAKPKAIKAAKPRKTATRKAS